MSIRMFRWQLLALFAALFFILPTQAYQHTLIYGLEAANAFPIQQGDSGHYTIQVAAFRVRKNALSYQSQLKKLTNYPVVLQESGPYPLYVILVGPMESSTRLRQVAYQLSRSRKKSGAHAVMSPGLSSDPSLPTIKTSTVLVQNANMQSYHRELANNPPVVTVSPAKSVTPTVKCRNAWFVGIEGGASWIDLDNDAINNGSFFSPPNNLDQYTTSSSDAAALVSLLAGYRWNTNHAWLPSFSTALRYRHYFNNEVDGDVIQFSIPAFNNYRYKFDTSSDLIGLLFKADVFRWEHFSPYLSVNASAAFNRFKNYSETAKAGVTARVSPSFGSDTNPYFSYGAGIGVDFIINQAWTASLGYEYQDLNQFKSGQGTNAWANSNLKFDNAHSHMALLTLSYQISS